MFDISDPYDLRHDVHIRYNYEEARFEGVPSNFAECLFPPQGSASTTCDQQDQEQGDEAKSQPSDSSRKPLRTKFSFRSPLHAKSASCSDIENRSFSRFHRSHKHSKRSRNASSDANHRQAADRLAFLAAGNPVLQPHEVLNQHFGISYRQVPRISVHGYQERIPAVLVMLGHHFEVKKGCLSPHIFRESPSKEVRDRAMTEIDRGEFRGENYDVCVLGELIKVWFRQLPMPILHQLPIDRMELLADQGGGWDSVAPLLGSLERSIIAWLADLLVRVADFEHVNHMGMDQLAIVMAPNLVRVETENPMVAVTASKAIVEVFRAILRSRRHLRSILGQDFEEEKGEC